MNRTSRATASTRATARRIDRILGAASPLGRRRVSRHGLLLARFPDAQRKLSPFLLLDYGAPHDFPPTENTRRGVGPHPHRGFETVTIAFQGSVAHHDSTGKGGVIGPGDVQWMTAASGILHREYHEEGFARKGGTMQMAQIWVNLPRAHKMDAPGYQAITADRIGVAHASGRRGSVRVIAGEYRGVTRAGEDVHAGQAVRRPAPGGGRAPSSRSRHARTRRSS